MKGMIKMAKIGSPLFILRDECQKDLMGVIEKLAEIGFSGIEFLGFFGHAPADIKRKLDSCGLAAIGNHVSFGEFANHTDKVIADHKELGCGYVTVGAPDQDGLPGGRDYQKALNTLEKIGEAANAAGMKLLFHNHADELKNTYGGKTILENIMDDVAPGLLYLEPDFGWMQIGGAEPMFFADRYENRCPVVHFKDFIPAGDGFLFRPTGYGVVDYAALYEKISSFDVQPEWYVLDHDCSYARDIWFDLKISLEYMKNLMEVSKQ